MVTVLFCVSGLWLQSGGATATGSTSSNLDQSKPRYCPPNHTWCSFVYSCLLLLTCLLFVVFRGHSAGWTQLEHLRRGCSIGSRQVDLENQQRSQISQRTWAVTMPPGCLALWVHTGPGSEFRLILNQVRLSIKFNSGPRSGFSKCLCVSRWFDSMEESTCWWQESLTSCARWVSHWNLSLRNTEWGCFSWSQIRQFEFQTSQKHERSCRVDSDWWLIGSFSVSYHVSLIYRQ